MRVSCVQSTVIFLSEFTYKQNVAQMKCKVAFQPLPQKSPSTHVYHCMPLIMTDTCKLPPKEKIAASADVAAH